MPLDLRYPIVMSRVLFCTGQCQRHTTQDSVIYPDTEYNTCQVCGHKSTVHYDKGPAVIYKEVDAIELEGIVTDLNSLAGHIANRDFGHIGKKDHQFIDEVKQEILAIKRRVGRLMERKDVI
jgi:hypothetical protein